MSKTYRADGQTVFRRPVTTKHPDGTSSTSMGFPVADVCYGFSDPEGSAAELTRLLNKGEDADKVIAELVEALGNSLQFILAWQDHYDALPIDALSDIQRKSIKLGLDKANAAIAKHGEKS